MNESGQMPMEQTNRNESGLSDFDCSCEGQYLDCFVFDYKQFNETVNPELSEEEVKQHELVARSQLFVQPAICFYRVYKYEVNGKTYIRASRKAVYRRDRAIAVSEKLGRTYTVDYVGERPWISEIENHKKGPVDASNNASSDATLALVFGILAMVLSCTGIGSVVFGILAILKASKASKEKTDQTIPVICGYVFSGLGILIGLIFIIVYIFMLIIGVVGISSMG